jgi:hypothetical protein
VELRLWPADVWPRQARETVGCTINNVQLPQYHRTLAGAISGRNGAAVPGRARQRNAGRAIR